MQAEKYIRQYNALNGQKVSREVLLAFHADIKKYVNAGGTSATSYYDRELIKIAKKWSTILPKAPDKIEVQINPIALVKPNKVKSVKKVKAKPVKKLKTKPVKKVMAKPVKKAKAKPVKKVKAKSQSKSVVKTLNGFVPADKTPKQSANTFTLAGVIGLLLGLLQRFKLQIIISGETHSSKSQLGMQIANAFAAIGDTVAWVDWEQGGLDSKDTQASINRNVDPANRSRIHVSAEVERTVSALKQLAKTYKVIAVDSGTKVKEVSNAWLDDLRESCPNTVWIIMMQQNERGGTRGGASAEFDAPVVLKTYRPDHTTNERNYAVVFKNRGNKTGLMYNINKKEIIPLQS